MYTQPSSLATVIINAIAIDEANCICCSIFFAKLIHLYNVKITNFIKLLKQMELFAAANCICFSFFLAECILLLPGAVYMYMYVYMYICV